MAAIQAWSDSVYGTCGYRPWLAPEARKAGSLQPARNVLQTIQYTRSERRFSLVDANRWQSTIAVPAGEFHRWLREPRSSWLADAMAALGEVDDEVAEENLPAIDSDTRDEAARIIRALAGQPFAPTVYPTQDGEIAIHFKSPVRPSSVVILLNNGGQAECYAYTGGRSRRAHYDVSTDLPDGFIMEQLGKLTSSGADAPIATRNVFAMMPRPDLSFML